MVFVSVIIIVPKLASLTLLKNYYENQRIFVKNWRPVEYEDEQDNKDQRKTNSRH